MGARAVGACREVQRQVRHFPPDFFPSRVGLDLTALGRTSFAYRGLEDDRMRAPYSELDADRKAGCSKELGAA